MCKVVGNLNVVVRSEVVENFIVTSCPFFTYSQNNNNNWGRNKSFPNQVLFALGMGWGADATLMNLFNPTSGRDASHPCLINTWPMVHSSLGQVLVSRGVHGSVRVGFMPNPRPTRWHRVSDEKTRRRPWKPTGQVGSDPVGRRSGRSKLKICCQRFKSAATTCFLAGSSPDLSKTTRSEQNNTISSPDLRKTHRILAKNYQIFVGFEKNAPDLCCIWAKPSKP